MFRFWHHHGILGINARNLLYIKPLNKKAQIKFADDKMRTKQYLSARGVSTARIFGKVTNEQELFQFNWDALPGNFVVKPNAGYGGEGIVIIKGREGEGWLTIDDELLSHEDMVEHVNDILEGRYSITGSPDLAFFEERLVTDHDMAALARFGLPDIRVIVYNMVPVMAMVRVPSREGGGKANRHSGGIMLGIDLAKGEVTHMVHHNRVIKAHPDFGTLKGFKIPHWEECLLLATQIQQHVTLGYLAVDIVVDTNRGPTLLEINARAGLGVQMANLAPLRDRLDRVAGVKVKTPEKGVRMAQDLFGNKIERSVEAVSGKRVIGMEEEVTLNLKHGTKNILAKMNPSMNKNYLEEKLFRAIAHDKKAEKLKLGYTLGGQRGRTVFYPHEMADGPHQMILGRKTLANFFLDVSRTPADKKMPSVEATDAPAAASPPPVPVEDPWITIDNQLASYDSKLNLVAQLRPTNLEAEKTRFLRFPSYEPQFQYKPVPAQLMSIKSDLDLMRIDTSSVLGQLFEDKRQELLKKVDLIDLVGDDTHFPDQAERYMQLPPLDIIEAAEADLARMKPLQHHKGRLTARDAVSRLQTFLREKKLLNWEAKIQKQMVSRCVIGKNNRILVKAGEHFSRQDIDKIIAHEIEVHVYCTENGKLQPYHLLRRGTAGYLKTQEGLAVYHQSQVVKEGARDAIIGFNAVMWAREMGFRELFTTLMDLPLHIDEEKAWKICTKAKRGLSDTGKPGAFLKNALYYWGYKEIEAYFKSGGSFEDLFLGKFELSQLPQIRQIVGLQPPKFVPRKRKKER